MDRANNLIKVGCTRSTYILVRHIILDAGCYYESNFEIVGTLPCVSFLVRARFLIDGNLESPALSVDEEPSVKESDDALAASLLRLIPDMLRLLKAVWSYVS